MLVEEYRIKGRPEPPEILERHRKIAPAKRMKIPGFVKGAKARQCKSKHRYRDIELAKLVLRKYPDQRIYPCKYCGGYHLTKANAPLSDLIFKGVSMDIHQDILYEVVSEKGKHRKPVYLGSHDACASFIKEETAKFQAQGYEVLDDPIDGGVYFRKNDVVEFAFWIADSDVEEGDLDEQEIEVEVH